jgi:3-oxoacyl-[acyl-carrier protein] reductase
MATTTAFGSGLRGRAALVTGASRGIGRAIAIALAAEGVAVAVNCYGQQAEAESVVAEILAHGGAAILVPADVSDAAQVAGLVDQVTARFGRLDVLVNNAALTQVHKPWTEISVEEWDDVLATNLRSCFVCFRACYKWLKQSSAGRVINISSVTVLLGQPRLLHYVSSKGGVIAFTRSLAREVGDDSITVNAVTPGAIATEAEREAFPDRAAVDQRQLAVQSIKRRGTPEDIAGAVVFLASDAASFVTGQTINVDGGWAMH